MTPEQALANLVKSEVYEQEAEVLQAHIDKQNEVIGKLAMRVDELETALADAMGWDWHSPDLRQKVRARCVKALRGE